MLIKIIISKNVIKWWYFNSIIPSAIISGNTSIKGAFPSPTPGHREIEFIQERQNTSLVVFSSVINFPINVAVSLAVANNGGGDTINLFLANCVTELSLESMTSCIMPLYSQIFFLWLFSILMKIKGKFLALEDALVLGLQFLHVLHVRHLNVSRSLVCSIYIYLWVKVFRWRLWPNAGSEGGSCSTALTTNILCRKFCGRGHSVAGPSKEADDLNLHVMSPDFKRLWNNGKIKNTATQGQRRHTCKCC